jgi:glucose 1-dehydrogenase
MKGLAGKNVLITGASSGIGRAIAIRFAQEGAHVGLNYRSAAERADAHAALAETERQSTGGRSLLVEADVASERQVEYMMAHVIQAFGRLDVLINNAGIQTPAPSHQATLADFDRVLGVNLRGAVSLLPRGHPALSVPPRRRRHRE